MAIVAIVDGVQLKGSRGEGRRELPAPPPRVVVLCGRVLADRNASVLASVLADFADVELKYAARRRPRDACGLLDGVDERDLAGDHLGANSRRHSRDLNGQIGSAGGRCSRSHDERQHDELDAERRE